MTEQQFIAWMEYNGFETTIDEFPRANGDLVVYRFYHPETSYGFRMDASYINHERAAMRTRDWVETEMFTICLYEMKAIGD